MRSSAGLIGIVVVGAACASTPGAEPHDMSAAQHEAMAASDEKTAAAHHSQYDPGARQKVCGGGDPKGRGIACWRAVVQSNEEHRRLEEKHRKMATDHRAASQALRDAEARSCRGIPEEDRDISPFTYREDIASVKPLIVTPPPPVKGGSSLSPAPVLRGAIIEFDAVPGMTEQWLQRVIDCHLARNSVLGHNVPEMEYCPLVPKGVTADVTATATGFEVRVDSTDGETAREVLRRAESLMARSSVP
ncbi:MAG: hypothetical protein HUU21_25180 [Polyangiaceae bacterium]|nr:hypothetical protein [Polyangiaceae bacterium]